MYKAAYFLTAINNIIENENTQKLIELVSYFKINTLHTSAEKEINNEQIIFKPFENTQAPSLFIEEYFNRNFSFFQLESKENNEEIEEYKILFIKALHIISPFITKQNQLKILNRNPEFAKSEFKEDLLYYILPAYLGEEFIQLFDKELSLENICVNPELKNLFDFTKGEIPEYAHFQLDLSLQNPLNHIGININSRLYDKKNENLTQRNTRLYKEEIFKISNWTEITIHSISDKENLKTEIKKINNFLNDNSEYFKIISDNYNNPLFKTQKGKEALYLTLCPIAIGRIQKVLIEIINNNILQLTDKEWNIAIIERDLACSEVAIEDFKIWLEKYLNSAGKDMPKIKLIVFRSLEINELELNNTKFSYIEHSESLTNQIFDVAIDFSILSNENVHFDAIALQTKNLIRIRNIISNQILNHKKSKQILNNNIFCKSEYNNYLEFYNIHFDYKIPIQKEKLHHLFSNNLIFNAHNNEKLNLINFIKSFSNDVIIIVSEDKILSNLNKFDKNIKFNMLSKGLINMITISYTECIDIEFIKSLELFFKNNGKISAFFIDNIELISEFNYKFKPENYIGINNILQLLNKFNTTTLIIGFSLTCSYSSQKEIETVTKSKFAFYFSEKNENNIKFYYDSLKENLQYKTKNREIQTIIQILENNDNYYFSNKNLLQNLIFNEFNQYIDFEYIPSGLPTKITLNNHNTKFAEINLMKNDEITTLINNEKYVKISDFIKIFINKYKDKQIDLTDWLELSSNNNINANEYNILSFNNIAYQKLLETFKKNNFINLAKELIDTNFQIDTAKLLSKLSEILPENEITKIKENNLIALLRNYNFSVLALFRLAKLNIINIISIDYNNNLFIVSKENNNEIQLIENLANIINSLKLNNLQNISKQEIERYEGHNIYYKITNFYINFIYSEVIPLLKQNLLSLANAERLKIRPESNTAYSSYSNDFLISKYANPINVPNLIYDTENFTNSDFKIVQKYINECRNNNENLLHLQKSCEKLKVLDNNNLIINILYFYSEILITENSQESIDGLFDEFFKLYNYYELIFSELYSITNSFANKLYQYKPECKTTLEPIKNLKLVTGWLSNFNNKFLENYNG